MASIEPIHTKVAGRARFRIPGLRHAPPVKSYLERRLAGKPEVLEVSASCITGNLLIAYNSNNDHRSIAQIIEGIVHEYTPDADRHVSPKTGNHAGPAGRSMEKTRKRKPENTTGSEAVKPVAAAPEDPQEVAWHLVDKHAALAMLKSSETHGLSGQAAEALLKEHGSNLLPASMPRSGWQIF